MKFTDGFWLIRDGFDVQYAKHVQAARITKSAITCLVTPKVVLNRGATLNTATFDLEIDSPLLDVIRVRIAHHKGGKPALKFEISESEPEVISNEQEGSVTLKSGALEAILSTGENFALDFSVDGKVITSQREKSLAIVNGPDGTHYLSVQLALGVGENVYGLGERFTSFVKNGQSIDIWKTNLRLIC